LQNCRRDFDEEIIDWLAEEFQKDQGIDLRQDRQALQRLKEAAEKAKCELSSSLSTNINLPFVTADQSGPKHLNIDMSRSQLEKLIGPLIKKTEDPCRKALKDAGLVPNDIDEVILVGGSTRIPMVQETVQSLFGKEPCKGVNPDEVVAIGAAIQGGVLGGEVNDVLLLDVTPLSLGIETQGAIFARLIERNTTIPTKKSEIFSTASNNQPAVSIHVLQGEREIATHNRTLGKFDLVGIPPAPRGVPQIEVTFDIDANGIVHVSARDLGTGKEQKIKIEASSGLSDNEIDDMIKQAEEHAEEDKAARETAEVRNNADSMVNSMEKQLEELGDKIADDDKKNVEEAIEDVKKALESNDSEAIKSAADRLEAASHKISEAMYQQAAAEGATAEGAGEATEQAEPEAEEEDATEGDVVDAEFEVEEEDNEKSSTE